MTDLPYTDDDLRAEAARQHRILIEDPDYMGIGEQMESRELWDDLGEDAFDAAQRKIDQLLNDAADTSAWAIDLGADQLEPHSQTVDSGTPGDAFVRILFAFSSHVPDTARAEYIANARRAITGTD